MRSTWMFLLLALLFPVIIGPQGADATSVSLSMEEDEHMISVDPTDPEQGSLEIEGEVQVTVSNLLETVTVELSVNITELRGGEPTGRYWQAVIVYGTGSVGQSTKVFKRNDGPAPFTVTLGPELYNPGTDTDIPVPAGLGLDVEGRMAVTADYSGSIEGKRTVTATIFPEPYHLINLSTREEDLTLSAGGLMNRTLWIRNAGNNYEDVIVEVDLIDDLKARGWNASISTLGKDGMRPGEDLYPVINIKAPREIRTDEKLTMRMVAYTRATFPDSDEPLSSAERTVNIHLRKSSLPVPDDDDDDEDDDDGDEGTDPLMAILVVALVIAVIVVLIILLFKKGRGGDGDERDPHSSMFRI